MVRRHDLPDRAIRLAPTLRRARQQWCHPFLMTAAVDHKAGGYSRIRCN
jgi:uncharacterized membrane protein